MDSLEWKNKNKKYLFETQKFLDLVDNIENEQLRKEIIYQFIQCDRVLTQLAEKMIENNH